MNNILRLSKGWAYLEADDGVEFWSLSNQRRLKVRGNKENLLSALKILGKGVKEDSLSKNKLNLKFIQSLKQNGILVSQSENESSLAIEELYKRQVEHFCMFEKSGITGQDLNYNLQNKKVVVIGVGGHGSWITFLLARIGIKNIVTIDHDTVEENNLSRQILYSHNDIGIKKVHAAETLVKNVDKSINYTGHDINIRKPSDLTEILDGVDLVFNPFGFTDSNVRDNVAKACFDRKIPYLLSGGHTVGPLCIPYHTACHNCINIGNESLDELFTIARQNHWAPPRVPFAPSMAIICALTVLEASRFLAGNMTPKTLNGYYTINTYNYGIEYTEQPKNPTCSFCNTEANK